MRILLRSTRGVYINQVPVLSSFHIPTTLVIEMKKNINVNLFHLEQGIIIDYTRRECRSICWNHCRGRGVSGNVSLELITISWTLRPSLSHFPRRVCLHMQSMFVYVIRKTGTIKSQPHNEGKTYEGKSAQNNFLGRRHEDVIVIIVLIAIIKGVN